MPAVTQRCCACRAPRPAAVIATRGDGRRLALCPGCAGVPAYRAAFVAAFRARGRAAARAAGSAAR